MVPWWIPGSFSLDLWRPRWGPRPTWKVLDTRYKTLNKNPSSTRTQKDCFMLCFHRLLRFIAHLNVEKLPSQSDRMRDSCLAATNDLVGLCSRSHLDSEKYFGIQSEPHVIVSVISDWLWQHPPMLKAVVHRRIFQLDTCALCLSILTKETRSYDDDASCCCIYREASLAHSHSTYMQANICKPSDLWRVANHSPTRCQWGPHSEAVAVKLSSHWSLRKSGSCLKVLVFCLASMRCKRKRSVRSKQRFI